MDWNRIEGNWKQFSGRVKEKWGKLTNDDLDVINGRRDQLEGKIQERYGIAKEKVRSDVDTWLRSLPPACETKCLTQRAGKKRKRVVGWRPRHHWFPPWNPRSPAPPRAGLLHFLLSISVLPFFRRSMSPAFG